jgi:regulatory protein
LKKPKQPQPPPDSVGAARDRALRLLAIRPRSCRELTRALTDRGFAKETARAAAARLAQEGWLDDLSAAKSLVRVKGARYGRSRLARELSARGFSSETAAAALASEAPGREEGALSRAFERLWRTHKALPLLARRKKVRAALARRGFSGAAISEKIREAHESD